MTFTDILTCPYTGEVYTKPNGEPCTRAEFPHGIGIGGLPRTWTGRVVGWRDWPVLSEWDKNGPDGRIWDGIAQAWVYPPSDDAEAAA